MTIAEQLVQNKTDLDNINGEVITQADLIDLIKAAVDALPELDVVSNPGGPADVAVAKQVLDGDGNLITGTLEITKIVYNDTTGTLTIGEI